MLIFLAGYEIEFDKVRGDTLKRSLWAWGISLAVGEFGPVLAMTLLLSGRSPGESTAVLAVFALLTAGAVWWAMRPRPPWFSRVVAKTLHSSGQFAVRLVVLLLMVMLGVSQALGLDTLLGAFAAGMINATGAPSPSSPPPRSRWSSPSPRSASRTRS